MSQTGIRARTRVLIGLAASCGALFAAAPAMASQVTISGTGDSQACTVSADFHFCGGALAATFDGTPAYGLLWFDGAGNVPANSTIDSAYLKLPQNGLTDSPCDLGLDVAWEGDDWSTNAGTSSPTWDSPDGTITGWEGGQSGWLGGFFTGQSDCEDSGSTAVFDVTDPTSSMYSGAESSSSFEVLNESSDAGEWGPSFSDPPELVVDYH